MEAYSEPVTRKFHIVLLQIGGMLQILRYFESPLNVILMRFGLLRSKFCSYSIKVRDRTFNMLARPRAQVLSDLNMIRSVIVEQEYARILPLLPDRPLRVLDIGSNIGSFAVWISKERQVTEIRCFEPDHVSRRLCAFNLEENSCEGGFVLQKAVGGTNRIIRMSVDADQPCAQNIYEVREVGSKTQEVEVVAFSELVGELQGDYDLLKLDCEGAEWEIIRNTPPFHFAKFGLIVAELHANPDEETRLTDFRDYMENAGFKTVSNENKVHGLYIGYR